MPRKPRFYVPKVPVHVVQRGNNRKAIFFDDSDYAAYLDWLIEAAERFECKIHAYVLMSNHVHLLMTPTRKTSISTTMQHVGRCYVPYINYSHGRTGTLWEGRYKGSIIDSDTYLLTCMRYIEQNPVRAGMVNHPSAYRWSSFGYNAYGRNNAVLTPHELYRGLARTAKTRRQAYQELFRRAVETKDLEEIRAAWRTGTPLGSDRFKKQIEKRLKIKVGYAKRGRPTLDK